MEEIEEIESVDVVFRFKMTRSDLEYLENSKIVLFFKDQHHPIARLLADAAIVGEFVAMEVEEVGQWAQK